MTTAKVTVKPVEKPGQKTTEFALSLAVIIAATVLRFTGDIAENSWAIAVGLQGAGYSLSRGLAKRSS